MAESCLVFYFAIITSWRMVCDTSFKNIDSPSSKDTLFTVWLILTLWFRRSRFLNFVNVFTLLCNYLPMENVPALHLNKLEFPLPKDALCQVWLKLGQWFWRRRWKCEKITTTSTMTTTTTDKFWSEKLTWAFGTGELKTILGINSASTSFTCSVGKR